MTKAQRFSLVGGVFAVVFALIAFFFIWALSFPPTVAAADTTGGTDLTLQTVGTIGFGPHPTWVSYLVRNAAGRWIHTTLFQLPANSLIHVTLYEYDSQGPLRNEAWGQVTGTTNGVEYVNGKRTTVSNANGNTAPAHTFTVPALGINVPLVGEPSTVKNLCSTAPCGTSSPHTTIHFSFRTPGPGNYRWQCFVPCGLGFLDGNGGPMQTLGYMGGFLQVVGA